MMKHSLLISLLVGQVCMIVLGGGALGFAQTTSTPNNFSYRFEYEDQPYQPLAEATSLMQDVWDDPVIQIDLGFTFKFFDRQVDRLFLMHTRQGEVLVADSSQGAIQPAIMISQVDLADRAMADQLRSIANPSLSSISKKMEGEVGKRHLILQFENAGFAKDIKVDSQSTDYLNFQLHFYEEGSNLDLHFGSSQISQPDLIYENQTGPAIGVLSAINASQGRMLAPGIWLEGYPDLPMSVVSQYVKYLQGDIPAGKVYHIIRTEFAAGPTTSLDAGLLKLNVYPQPADGQLFVDGLSEPVSAKVFDAAGRLVMVRELQPKAALSLEGIAPGYYTLQLEGKQTQARQRFVKQ